MYGKMPMPKWLQSVDVLFVIIIKLRGAVDVVDRLKGDAVIFGYAFQYTHCPILWMQ